MAQIDQHTSAALNIIRLPLAFLIVAGHANTLLFPLKSHGDLICYDYSLIKYPIHLLSQVLFCSAVPLFFVISGFLFFVGLNHYGLDEYKDKMARRAKTLLVPYLMWNLIYLIRPLVGNILKDKGYSMWFFIESLWIDPGQTDRIALMDMATPADPPLWFIRDLMVCMVLSPGIWYVARHRYLCSIVFIALFVPWFMNMPIQYPFPGISIPSMLFFLSGAILAVRHVNVAPWLDGTKHKWVFAVITTYIFLAIVDLFQVDYMITFNGENIDATILHTPIVANGIALIGCIVFMIIAYRVACSNMTGISEMGGAFSVFATHWMLLSVSRMLIEKICPVEISQLEGFVLFLMLVAIGFLGGLIINYVLIRNCYLAKLFLGGRT